MIYLIDYDLYQNCLHYDFFDFLIGYDLCLIIVFIQSFKIPVQTFYFTYGEPGLFTNLFIHWFCSQSMCSIFSFAA